MMVGRNPSLFKFKRSLTSIDVGFLYQVIAAAETKPEADRLPFRALFEAYDEVVGEHGVNADPGHACLRFLFKMGSKDVRGETLFDKFENALQQMGIVIEIGEDGSTNLNETHDYDQYTVDVNHTQTVDRDHSPITNGVPPTPKRRASFNTTYDIGEDPTQRSLINRPSSRSSMSRLDAERISEASKNRDLKARLSHLGHRAAGPNKSSRKRGARRIKDMREQRHSAISNSKRMGTIDSTHAPSIEAMVG